MKKRKNVLIGLFTRICVKSSVRRLSEEYIEKLNRKIAERLKPAREVGGGCYWNAPVQARQHIVFSQPEWEKGVH